MSNHATDTKESTALEPRQSGSVVIETDATSLMDVISRAANDPNTDVGKLERLMGLYERITDRNAKMAFNNAMTEVQADTAQVRANASNPQTKSRYATYAALDSVLRPTYTTHGFSISYDTGDGAPENYVRVLAYVSHRDGFSKTYKADMPADGKGAKGGDVMTKTHAAGSAMSYGMRYLLKMIFNIAIGEGDDDGNAAGEGDRISEDELKQLQELGTEVGADTIKFCKYFRISSLADLPARRFSDAMAALEAKRENHD